MKIPYSRQSACFASTDPGHNQGGLTSEVETTVDPAGRFHDSAEPSSRGAKMFCGFDRAGSC